MQVPDRCVMHLLISNQRGRDAQAESRQLVTHCAKTEYVSGVQTVQLLPEHSNT